jgi:hypothetical protein
LVPSRSVLGCIFSSNPRMVALAETASGAADIALLTISASVPGGIIMSESPAPIDMSWLAALPLRLLQRE